LSYLKTGGCQCGAVRYEITHEPIVVYACHCTECQRQSGAAFGMTAVIPKEHFRLTRGELKNFPRTGDSGRTMLCWFCATCGTRIYHSPANLGQNCNIKPGTLDDTSWLVPTVHVWTRSAQSWVRLPESSIICETQPADRRWLTGLLQPGPGAKSSRPDRE
jgi:hypothetical protein